MRITAKQLAEKAGVSQATVSLVLRGKPGVSDSVRIQILQLAREMGLEPQFRAAPTPNGKTIQLVIYKRHGQVMADTPFFEQLTQGVADEAASLGYHLSISYFYGNQPAKEQIHSIQSLNSAGLILLATEMHSEDVAPFFELSIPLVVLDNSFPALKYDAIAIDNALGAWKAVHYLIDCGHTRIGYLHSSVEIYNFRERQSGYLSACRSLPGDAAKDSARRIIPVRPSSEEAAEDMAKYLDTEPMLPTAFFADNDRIAAGCCKTLLKYGYRIPDNISVIGFDDSAVSEVLNPPLTTMQIQKQRMGALAVERLNTLLCSSPPERVRIAIAPEVLVRQSVLVRNSAPASKKSKK